MRVRGWWVWLLFDFWVYYDRFGFGFGWMCALRCFAFALVRVVIVGAGFAVTRVVGFLGWIVAFLVLCVELCFGSFPWRGMDLGFGSLRFEYFGCFGCGNVIWFVLLCLDGVVFAGGIW